MSDKNKPAPTEERRPCEAWVIRLTGNGWSGNTATLPILGCRIVAYENGSERADWHIHDATIRGPHPALVSGTASTLAAAQLAAEDAAAEIVRDILRALGRVS